MGARDCSASLVEEASVATEADAFGVTVRSCAGVVGRAEPSATGLAPPRLPQHRLHTVTSGESGFGAPQWAQMTSPDMLRPKELPTEV